MARSFKRQYQPSISSYFGSIPRDHDTTHTVHASPSVHSNNLPTAIQSSLLNVGMRVRKSVPEGYQTREKTSSSLSPPVLQEGHFPVTEHLSVTAPESAPVFHGLVPYCGILKVGGLASQPIPAEEDLPSLLFDDDESLPSSSQASYAPSVATAAMTPSEVTPSAIRKRRRQDADDEDLGLESQPVSPRSRPISHTRMPNLDQVRPIALPKSKGKVSMVDDVGGEMRESEMIDIGDFSDAPFFCPEEWGRRWN